MEIFLLQYSLGLSLSFTLYLIYKKCNKSKKDIHPKQNKSFLVSVSKRTVSGFKKFLWIIFIAIIDFISNLLRCIIYAGEIYDFSSWIINCIFMCLYFYFIFKIKLYKHHYLCIICFGLIGIISNVIAHIDMSRDKSFSPFNDFLQYALHFVSVTLNNLTFVIYKLFIEKTYLKSYEILFFQGLIELLLSSILNVILIKCKVIYSLHYYLEKIKNNLINLIALIFLNFGFYSQIYIIIDLFSPFHIFIIIMLYCIIIFSLSFIPTWLNEEFNYFYLICIIILFICLFFILVFIEIIELNCFGLSYMTKKNIELRAQLENNINSIDEDNDEKSDNEVPYEGYIIELNNNEHNGFNDVDNNSSSNEDYEYIKYKNINHI